MDYDEPRNTHSTLQSVLSNKNSLNKFSFNLKKHEQKQHWNLIYFGATVFNCFLEISCYFMPTLLSLSPRVANMNTCSTSEVLEDRSDCPWRFMFRDYRNSVVCTCHREVMGRGKRDDARTAKPLKTLSPLQQSRKENTFVFKMWLTGCSIILFMLQIKQNDH